MKYDDNKRALESENATLAAAVDEYRAKVERMTRLILTGHAHLAGHGSVASDAFHPQPTTVAFMVPIHIFFCT
jgi:hypothetical protein